MPRKDPLLVYKKKRDFKRTPEPAATKARSGKKKFPSFVIQKHAARRLHYDFRLEVNGVLKSWAVPKGPSLNPKDKRLAVPTEDHPMDYAHFEGTIPQGEYGGGAVIVWDRGYYINITEKRGKIQPMKEALEKGHVLIWIEGEKVKGGFALTRMGFEKSKPWLLVKMKDTEANLKLDLVSKKPKSVLSGRDIKDLAKKE